MPDLGWWYVPFAVVRAGRGDQHGESDGRPGRSRDQHVRGLCRDLHRARVRDGPLRHRDFLLLPHYELTGELTIFCGSLVGASLGFLWWNAHPADIFMGDVGSLGLGGALGTVALLTKQELLLPIVGGVFVLEGLSVIIQVASFKLTRQARLPHGAAAPSLRAHRLGGAEGHHAIPDPRDRLRAAQSHHVEAEVTGMSFSVNQQHVVVAGGGRSGLAAAELLRVPRRARDAERRARTGRSGRRCAGGA